MKEQITTRKGARKAQDIPEEILMLLNTGKIETVNLTEWLAINQTQLLDSTFPDLGLNDSLNQISIKMNQLKKPSTMSYIKTVGEVLYKYCNSNNCLDATLEKLSYHTSDTLRCYATYLISLNERLNIEDKLNQSQKLIADTHFGVREVVWMALRPEIEKELKKSISILYHWTNHTDPNIRRFTTEAIRPRGVWCKHIEALKERPEQALSILENLKSDASKYVQDSVSNWLNDASKSKPDFVLELCDKWEKESPTKATEKIIKRAKRTLDKIANSKTQT